MLYKREEKTIKINNTTMDYIAFGYGTKPLVLIPGLSFNRVKGTSLWIAVLYRIFAKDYRVYMIDRIEEVPEGYSVEDIARDTADAMKQVGIEGAYILGVSQGGMIAQCLAMDYPELVDKMVLAVTLARPNATVESCIDSWIDMVKGGRMEEFTKDMLVKMYSESFMKKYGFMVPLAVKLYKPKGIDRFIILSKAASNYSRYDELDKIKCPVFVIGAQEDLIVTGAASKELADKLNCSFYMYEGMGHGVTQELEKDFDKRVYQFFQS